MKEIKDTKGKILHLVYTKKDFSSLRTELISSNNFIQCSALLFPKGHTFKPHKHIWKEGPVDIIAQESWCVIEGSVEVSFFDTNGKLLEKHILYPGDVSFTLEGGHTYLILEDNTFVYEYKTGPYQGQNLDKEFFT